ncbi:MAG TPA: PHP domain-containing protein, partial [Spirochaetota bacterium]|nr:PHP domain-containing protein [Spirochaetota bacterium]
MKEPCADLHTHSTCSDGTQTPEEVVAAADFSGVAWLALTDHDTIDGVPRVRAAIAARELPIELITGAELSCHSETDGEVHILAYGFDEEAPSMLEHMRDFRDQRHIRLGRMLDLLRDLGCPLEKEDVMAFCKGESVSRVHVASALARHGYVANPSEAFRLYLSNGGPAYVPRKKYSPEQMIPMIHEWGGVAVMAHPNYFDSVEADDAGIESRLERYIAMGIDGF